MSENKKGRIFRCAVCGTAEITESHVEIIDQNAPAEGMGCNFSDYKDHAVAGGVLFDDRPEIHWRSPDFDWEKLIQECPGEPAQEKVAKKFAREAAQQKEMPPVGGICHDCLKNAAIQALLPRIRGLKIK